MPSRMQYARTTRAAVAANLGVQAFSVFYHMPFWARLRWFLMGATQPKVQPTLAEAARAEKAKRVGVDMAHNGSDRTVRSFPGDSA